MASPTITTPDEAESFGTPVGPDEAELPAEPPDRADLDPFEGDPAGYDDLAAFVSEEWREATTARERVRDVIARASESVTASTLAELADVSEPTARTTLRSLVDEQYVKAESSKRGTVYRRDPDWYRMQRVRQLANESQATVESVLERIEDEIRTYRQRYGVDSPTDLVVDGEELDEQAWRDVSEWRTAQIDRQYVRTDLQFQRLREADDVAFSQDRDDVDSVRS